MPLVRNRRTRPGRWSALSYRLVRAVPSADPANLLAFRATPDGPSRSGLGGSVSPEEREAVRRGAGG